MDRWSGPTGPEQICFQQPRNRQLNLLARDAQRTRDLKNGLLGRDRDNMALRVRIETWRPVQQVDVAQLL